MITLSLLFRSQGDELAGHATVGAEQAWSAALSGIQEAIRDVSATAVGCTDWQDDSATFRARPVYQDGADQWFFTVFSPADSDALVDIRYGLSDEAGRINLNHPGDADLTKIPGITATLAGILRQFVGQGSTAATPPDTNTPGQGTVSSPLMGSNALMPVLAQYAPLDTNLAGQPTALTDPASPNAFQLFASNDVPRHGLLATLDELMLAPGFNRALLHGAPAAPDDQSASGTNGSGAQFPTDNSKPRRSRGLDQYFTVFSRDPNRTNAGQPRCNLNDTNDPLPSSDLPAGFSNYVAAVRGTNTHFAHPCEALEAVTKTTDNRGVETEVASGITKENLPVLLDLFSADKEDGHDGLINVNTASSTVLATLPGIDLPLAESIVSTRTGLSPERRATIAWLYQEGVVDAVKFKAIAPYLTARSAQFHFNVIGYGLPSGRYRVLEAVIDLAGTTPRIAYLRDITRLGLPISLKEENPAKPNDSGTPVQSAGAYSRNHPNG